MWRDGSAVKSSDCSYKGPGSVLRMVAHGHQQWDLMPSNDVSGDKRPHIHKINKSLFLKKGE